MLSPEAVIAAGLALVRETGLTGLGVRALAERVGVTPMALYRHVDGAEELERKVIDAILAAIEPAPASTPFRDAALAWAASARAVLGIHPGVAEHVLTHWFELPRVLDMLEGLLAAAEVSGMEGPLAVAAANAVFTFVLMRVTAETAVRRAGVVRRKLPRGASSMARWPRLVENAREYEVAKLDLHFAFGLDVILRGIEGRCEC